MPPEAADNNAFRERGVRWKRLKSDIIQVAKDFIRDFRDAHPGVETAGALLPKVRQQIKTIHRLQLIGGYGDIDLDRLGTDLWNRCTHLRREAIDIVGGPQRALVLCGRIFAFDIIHLAQWEEGLEASALAHLMKVALKAGRSCLEDNELELGLFVMQRAASYDLRAKEIFEKSPGDNDDARECTRLRAEYFAQRAAFAWKEDRLDLAEHIFSQIETLLPSLDSRSAEMLADVLFEIGKDLTLSKQDFPMAVKWLGRSSDVINIKDIGQLSLNAANLRLSISHAHITALLGLGTTEGLEQAQSLIGYIESEIGDKLFVLILRLELLNRAPGETFDSEGYASILRRIVKAFNCSDSNYKLLNHHINRLHRKCPGLGTRVADEFLARLEDIGPSDQNAGWYEKLVVLRVWMTNQHDQESVETVEQAHAAFSRLQRPLGAEGAVAAQTLLWKLLDHHYNSGNCELARKWCQIALLPIFADAGPMNRAKIERKLLLCSISLNDMPASMSVFHSMSEQAQGEPMTRYLMYKVAVRSGDRQLALECLEGVSNSSQGEKYLYGCVLDSQRAGDVLCSAEAMKMLVTKYEFKEPGAIHYPTLLRCAIRLWHKLLDAKDEPISKETAIKEICRLFDAVLPAIERHPKDDHGSTVFEVKELEWFCQNAYNLGVANVGDWDHRMVVRILNACIKIIDQFPSDAGSEVASGNTLRSIFCNFINASALAALARTQDDIEQQLQDYLNLRGHVAAYCRGLESYREGPHADEGSYGNLLKKLSVLLVFDFEAACALRHFNQLGEVVRRAHVCENVLTFQAMAECLLRARVSGQVMFSTMRLIINELWEREGMDAMKLAKYMRLLFQATMAMDTDRAFTLLEEVCQFMKDATSTNDSAWPTDEVEWIAITAYNHAMDCFFGSDDQGHAESRRWAEKAMGLAHYCPDGGSLEDRMHERYLALKLDGRG